MATTEQILPTMRRSVPQIYMYDDTSFPGWIKIGQTTRADVRQRINEQHPITEPHKTYHLLWHDNAFYADGSGESFSDHDLHEVLRRMGKELIGEWCRCSLREAKAAYVAVRHRDTHIETVRDLDHKMRKEQEQAVKQTADTINWDLIVLDEYHFGAWNDHAKSLLDLGDSEAKNRQTEEDEVMRESGIDVESGRAWDDEDIPISGRHFLYLSGTPFRALATGEFMENQIFNWTYQDEQKRKEAVGGPYMEMPTMVMMTYQMPQDLGAMIE